MSITITGDLSWTGDLVLFLEALDGGPAADTDGYTFTSSGDMEYSCSITDTILGLYRCVAKTSGGIIAGAGYVTVGASTTAARIRSEEAAELDSAVQTQLDDIEASVDAYIAGISAVASTTTGTIVGFPSSLNVGDSYTDEANASIHVFIRDASDDPITAVGDFNFTDPEFAPEVNITQSGSTGRVKAVVTFIEASPEDYLKVEIPSSQSRRASPGTATIQCLLKWVDPDGKVLCQKTLSKQAVTWNEMV